MSAADVVEAWGRPNAINRTRTEYGAEEQWVYERFLGRTLGSEWRYVYIRDGKVTAIQD